MIIDAHLHVFLSAAEDHQRTVDPLAPADRRAPVELLVEEMGRAGVERAVLVPLGPEDDYVSSVLAADPGRYQAIAVADPADTDPGRTEARLEKGGFSGLRMFELAGSLPDAPWLPTLRRLEATGRVLWLYPRPEDVPTVAAVAAHFEDLTIVLNHCGFTQAGIDVDENGRPRIHSTIPQETEGAVLDLAEFPNVYVILSGAYGFSHDPYPYPDVGEAVRRLHDRFGADRLMWASDFPWIIDDPGYGACLELVDHHLPGLSGSERDAILGGTCRTILDWPKE